MKRRKEPSTFRIVGAFDLPVHDQWVRILNDINLGVLGGYDDLRDGTRIFTARNGEEFLRLSRPFRLERVWAVTASNANNLLDPDWERAKRNALHVVETARQRDDRMFLREVVSRACASSVKRGRPPANLAARRRVVKELKRRISGRPSQSLRKLVRDEAAVKRAHLSTESGQLAKIGIDAYSLRSTEEGQRALADAVRFHKSIKSKRSKVESKNRSLSARVSELCWKTYTTWVLWGELPVDQSLSQVEAEEFKKMGFHLPRELDLLRKAIAIGKQQLSS